MKTTSHLLISVLCICSYQPAKAIPPQWIIPQGTTANFTIDGMLGIDVDGTLDIVKSNILFDPGNVQTATMDVTLNVASLKTGIAKRDKHVKSADYFDAARLPYISFHATTITKKDATHFEARGVLKIKEVSKTIVIPFTFVQQGNSATFKGDFKILRSDYRVGSDDETGMGNEVRISLKIPAVKSS